MFFGAEAKKYKEIADLLRVERDMLTAELALYKEIAALSNKEAIIVLDKNNEPLFYNTLATNISNKEAVVHELAKEKNEIIVGECEASVISKNLSNGLKGFILIKSSVVGSEQGGLLEMHQKSIRGALDATQHVFIDILDKLKEMVDQSNDTARGSDEGLKIAKHVDEGMNQLAELMEGTLSTTASLVNRSHEVSNVVSLIKDIAD
ncbi:MAG: hypothetical protein WA010_06125, partial [Sulfuricurvum sp.]